jgi:hypothetical protein
MTARYLLRICLVLAMAVAGCKKEPEPAAQKPTAVQEAPSEQPVPDEPASEPPVRDEAVTEQPVPEKTEPEEAAPQEEPGPQEEEYFAVFMEGKKVGHAVQTRVVAEGKVRTTEKVSIQLSRGSVPISVEMAETSIETADGKPVGFEVVQDMGLMTMKVTGTVVQTNGQRAANVTVMSMGGEQKSTIEWPEDAVMAEGLRLLQLKKGLKQGTAYIVKLFSPQILQALDAEVKVGPKQEVDLLGRVVELTEVVTKLNVPGAGEIVSTGYVDDEQRMQKNIMPIAGMQVEMVACAKEFALGENDVLELIDKMFLPSPTPLENVTTASSITYHLSPSTPGGKLTTIPRTDNQSVQPGDNGGVIVTVQPVQPPTGAKFPYRGSDKAILEAIQPTRFLQSDREEIIELARRAVGSTKDAAEAVRNIESFVAAYIENKNLSVGYASAAEVVASKQGDCSEHAVLTAAMCRAVGIPAQVVAGVAYVEEFAGLEHGFGWHAWTQAYVGDKWIGLDAAFKGTGRGGYGPGHIALSVGNGDPEDFFNLVNILGQLRIDKVTINQGN